MKKLLLLIVFISLDYLSFAQQNWFDTYSDSTNLVKDAQMISARFLKDVKALVLEMKFEVSTIHNTTPYLIYYDENSKTANLPLWSEVIPDQQKFFYSLTGSEAKGKEAFGLFFNGFYLPHELGHALQSEMESGIIGSYENEYFANIVAMLWWKKIGRGNDLKRCYETAKLIWSKLPNPVPEGKTIEAYFTENYNEAGSDPYVYGYMQFKQFIQIYEDKTLPEFDEFVMNYIKKKK